MTSEEMKKKSLSQGSYGSLVPSLLNDSPFFDDSIAEEEKTDVKLQTALSAYVGQRLFLVIFIKINKPLDKRG